MLGNFFFTLALILARSPGGANSLARARAALAWPLSGIGYDRSGPANSLSDSACRAFAFSFAIVPAYQSGWPPERSPVAVSRLALENGDLSEPTRPPLAR